MASSGFRKSHVKFSTVFGVILARYVLLPAAGIGVVKAVAAIGFLPQDPLFQYALLIQFALPPAMAIGMQTLLLLSFFYPIALWHLEIWHTCQLFFFQNFFG